MLIRLLPLVAGLLPIVAIHASFLISVEAELVPSCMPYIDGCTSISATGRHPPASYLFKAAMLPQSLLLVAFWLASIAWLRALEGAAGRNGASGTVIGAMGTAGSLFLIVYVTLLGTEEPIYEFMRRFGVYLYFLLSVLAQLGLAFKARRLSIALGDSRLETLTSWQLVLAIVPFVLGILNLVLKATLADPDPAENVIEWIFALLMQVYFLFAWVAWQRTRFVAHVDVY